MESNVTVGRVRDGMLKTKMNVKVLAGLDAQNTGVGTARSRGRVFKCNQIATIVF
jgi:hypothetical protein